MSVFNQLKCLVALLSIHSSMLTAAGRQFIFGNGDPLKGLSLSEEIQSPPYPTVMLNGTTYKVSTEICSGGIMLKRRLPVDELCGVGVFSTRTSGCDTGNDVVVGRRNVYTCSSFPGGIQALLPVVRGHDFDEVMFSTTEDSSTTTSVRTTMQTTTLGSTSSSTPHYLSAEELKSRADDLMFEHNNLIAKRGAVITVEEGGDVRDTTAGGSDEVVEVETTEVSSSTETVLGKRGSPAETEAPEESKSDSQEDTVPLEESETSANDTDTFGGVLGGSGYRVYDVKPIKVKVVTEKTVGVGGGKEGSDEDTLPIVEPDITLPVIDSVLNGRSDDLADFKEGPAVDFNTVVLEKGEFSSEKDEAGGEWESWEGGVESEEVEGSGGLKGRSGGGGVELPQVGTVEYDAVTGGFGKWIGMTDPCPLFDAHVTLLRKQIDFEIIQWGSHTNEVTVGQQTNQAHVSVIGLKDLPYNATWFKILGEIVTTANTLIPEELFRDPFSVPGGKNKRDGTGVVEPANNFFDDVLRIFGYFTRSYDGGGVEVKDSVLSGLDEVFRNCRKQGKKFRKGCEVGVSGVGNGVGCFQRIELKSVNVSQLAWNEYNASYSQVSRVVDFSSLDDLPPTVLRINPTKWIFAEVMWYAVQITYMFCYEAVSGGEPNAFMLAYDVVLRLFESDLVGSMWDEVGGNLGVFEMILPYVRRSFIGVGEPNDFRSLLGQLDKVAGALLGSVVGGFGRKKKGKLRRGKVRNSWDEVKKRRRRRDVVGEGDGEGRGSGGDSLDAAQAKKVFSQTGWFGKGGGGGSTEGSDLESSVDDRSDLKNETATGLLVDGDILGSTVRTITRVQEYGSEVTPDVISTTIGTTSTSTSTLATSTTTTTSPTSSTTTTTSTTTKPTHSTTTATITMTAKPTMSTAATTTTTATPKPTTTTLASTSTSGTTTTERSSSRTTTTASSPPTLPQFEDPLRLYEIWDGMAYCIVNDGMGNVRPSLEEMKRNGVCE